MAGGSKKAVLTAIGANAIVTVIKFIAATLGGSAAMLNEAIHSLMDTINQGFLFFGLRAGERGADQQFAFGHGQKKYLWNLWSAIGLFSIGAGLGIAHAWEAWHQLGQVEVAASTVELFGYQIETLWINGTVLVIALVLEGYSFVVALAEFLRQMRANGQRNPFRYLLHADDPTLVAVVLEDSAAMLGLTLAAVGIGMTAHTGDPIWDVAFSASIAVLLGLIAFYLGYVNMRYLLDVRDPEAEAAFAAVVDAHAEVERYHDLRSIIVDEKSTVLVAEIELREEAIVEGLKPRIRARHDELLAAMGDTQPHSSKVRGYVTTRAAVEATLARTEEIIDELEAEIRQRAPQVCHVTIEVEGIAAAPQAEAEVAAPVAPA